MSVDLAASREVFPHWPSELDVVKNADAWMSLAQQFHCAALVLAQGRGKHSHNQGEELTESVLRRLETVVPPPLEPFLRPGTRDKGCPSSPGGAPRTGERESPPARQPRLGGGSRQGGRLDPLGTGAEALGIRRRNGAQGQVPFWDQAIRHNKRRSARAELPLGRTGADRRQQAAL